MKGSQEPRIKIEPARYSTDGPDAADLMSAYGNSLDDWQQVILDCWLGKDKNGNYNVTSAGVSVPRQNGKNVCIEAREFYGMVINGEKIIHTAHQVKTAKKSFRRLASMFEDVRHPEIKELVKSIRYTNGEEAIELWTGGTIEFSARSRQAARGFDGISVIVLDEAQELTDDQLEAIMSTLAASKTGNRQLIYAGTPPYPNCPGTVFRRRRNICLSEPGLHDSWHEWSVAAESVDKIKADDISLWYMTNPALGIHLDEEFTKTEFTTMTKDGFARERLGWWSPVLTEKTDFAIDKDAWNKCKSNELKPEGKTAYGVKFSADGTTVYLAGAVVNDEGVARISLIDEKSTSVGVQWLADWLNMRYAKAACVVIDGRNGVDVLIDKLQTTWKYKDSVVRSSTKTIIAAVSTLVNEVTEQTLTWYGQQEALNESATNAIKRPIGTGWGFGGEYSGPVEACSLALWGVRNSKRNPGKKMKIG